MGKAVVLYNSRGGNTKKVAKKIAEGLQADIFDHKNIPDLEPYQLVIVGSWVIAGRISFAGGRYLKRIARKHMANRKVALFFTSGAPDDVNPMGDKSKPMLIKDCMFNSMIKILSKNSQIEIVPEKFYSKGSTRMRKHGKPGEPIGHPSEDELAQAFEFGKNLTKYL